MNLGLGLVAYQCDLTDDAAQLAEAMSTAWAERAIALGVDARRQPTECPSKKKCVVCSAGPGQWCRATHAGERDAGGWVHPKREQGDVDEDRYQDLQLGMRLRDQSGMTYGANRTPEMHPGWLGRRVRVLDEDRIVLAEPDEPGDAIVIRVDSLYIDVIPLVREWLPPTQRARRLLG